MKNAVTREDALNKVRETLAKLSVSEEVRLKVVAVFVASKSPWWLSPQDYIDYLVRQLVALFSYKFEDERMSIPSHMVYLLSADGGSPSILLHWKIYLSLYRPFVKGWRLETIKNDAGEPIGMVAIVIDKEGNEWRWERYYNNLALTQRWKNKEIMFAKTILKESLGVMYPELNLMPPLNIVEAYDPDDIEPVAPSPRPNIDNGGAYVSVPSVSNSTQSSTEVVRNMAVVEPPTAKRDKSQDGDLAREVMDKFKELSSVVGADEAKKMVEDIIKDFGAARFNDLSVEQKKFVITALNNAIISEKAIQRR